jgi:hypothetical protein
LILNCTAKLLKELPYPPDPPYDGGAVASWHANLLIIQRRKCVFFVHDLTLFSLLTIDVDSAGFADLGETFTQTLFETLDAEEIHPDQIQRMLDWSRIVHIGKASNPSVIGAMSHMTQMLQRQLSEAEALHAGTEFEAIARLNRRPHQMMGFANPKGRLLGLLSAQGTA